MVCLRRPDLDGRGRLRDLLRPRRRAAQGLGQVARPRRGGGLPAPARRGRRSGRGRACRCERAHEAGRVRGGARAARWAGRRAPGVRPRAPRCLQGSARGDVRGRATAHAPGQSGPRPVAARIVNPTARGGVVAKPHTLDLEAGVGLNQRRSTLDLDEQFGTSRFGALYGYDFTQKARFEARGAYLLNLRDAADSEGSARLSLAAPVAGSLALKVSYDLLYRNQPLAGLEKLDTTFGVGVQATF